MSPAPNPPPATLLPDQLVTLLQSLSQEILEKRLQTDPALPPFAPAHYLSASAPIFAALHAVNRNSLTLTKACKVRTQEARFEMDSAHLRLQNLMYERNHLEREIRKCEEYESQYQHLPLLTEEDFLALAHLETPPKGLALPLPEDPHEFMLARLQFELTERQRFDDEKKELGVRKAKLVKENEVKKARLEELEKQVDDFITAAKAIQSKMHEEPQKAS